MVDFAGWDMPVQYAGVIAEHEAVRTAAGLFDVSHMGEVEFRGPGALEAANALITNDLTACADGQAIYAGLLNEQRRLRRRHRRLPLLARAHLHLRQRQQPREGLRLDAGARAKGAKPVDRSDDFAQIAVQGPKAVALVAAADADGPARASAPTASPRARSRASSASSPAPATRARTGSSCTARREQAEKLWDALLEEGKPRRRASPAASARATRCAPR